MEEGAITTSRERLPLCPPTRHLRMGCGRCGIVVAVVSVVAVEVQRSAASGGGRECGTMRISVCD